MLEELWERLRRVGQLPPLAGAADELAERRRRLKHEFQVLDTELERDERMLRAYEAQIALMRQMAESQKKE